MAKNNLYTKDSIESLSPLEFTRLRPGVYCGDTTYATQLLIEIVSNAIDEFRLGHGNVIDVTLLENGQVRVRDHGQGFLVNSMRPDGKTILEAAFSILNTSGKYREDGTYEGTSLGSFGIGSKITTYLSHWLMVTTMRDGMSETIKFNEGVFQERAVNNLTTKETGTVVEWLPSEEFFTNVHVNIDEIKKLFNVITCLCPGLTITLDIIDDKLYTYSSENGINDLVKEAVGNKEILKNRFTSQFSEGKNKLDLVMTYTSDYSTTIIPYVNTGLTQSGSHITQIKTLLTREMNKFFRDKGWLKEKDENLDGSDCQEGMYLVFNITAPNVAYDAQVKSRITKIDMKPFLQTLSDQLQHWFLNNEKEVKQIADKALKARKAREAAKKARDAARGIKSEKGLKAKMALSDKFIDCNNKNPNERNLLLVEGE